MVMMAVCVMGHESFRKDPYVRFSLKVDPFPYGEG